MERKIKIEYFSFYKKEKMERRKYSHVIEWLKDFCLYRNHDLPAWKSDNSYYRERYWMIKGIQYREKNLPSRINSRGRKEYFIITERIKEFEMILSTGQRF